MKKSTPPTSATPTPMPLNWRQRLWRNRNVSYVARGLVVSLPFIIILFLMSLVLSLILNVLSPISTLLDPGSEDPHWTMHFLSLIVLFTFFYLIGNVISGTSGKYYLNKFEQNYLCQIPFYTTIKDLVQQFAGIKKMPFSQVVLIDPFDSGVLMTGFITEEIVGDFYTVFVPTAPNPTNGNIYHVPASRLKFIKVPSETAMRTVVGMGTGSTCLFLTDEEPSIPTIPSSIVEGDEK